MVRSWLVKSREKQIPHHRSPAIKIGGRDRVRNDTGVGML